MASEEIPERPKADAPAEDAAAEPSKKAQKKAEKEAAKAALKARKQAERNEAEAKKIAEEAATDVSKDSYGDLPMVGSKPHKPSGHKRIPLLEVSQHVDKEAVVFRCVVETARSQSAKLAFLNLRQGLESIQAVVAASDTLSKQMVKFAASVPPQSMVLVHGLVKKPFEPINSATIKDFEIHIQKLYTISRAEIPLPMQVEDAERALPGEGDVPGQDEEPKAEDGRPLVTLNTRLNNRVIDLRAKINHAIFRIKGGVVQLFQEYLSQQGFTLIHTPKLLGAATEGGSNVFEVKYFDKSGFLAQSPQLYKQMLVAARFERVMEIGPVFRAENSNTARHLTEFTGLDLEMAFEEDYHEVMDVLEGLMLFIFKGLRERYAKETELVRNTYNVEEFRLPEAGKVPRIPFVEGIKMLREATGEELSEYEDLSTPMEKLLGKLVLEKYSTDFYVLDQFPLSVRPFYTMPSPHNPKLSNSYDFFMRGQEICSGAQRIHTADFLTQRMRAMDPPVDPESPGMRDYVAAFRYGCPPHGGGGFGLERIVSFWLGLPNIRLSSLFPRDPGRIMP
ncbi:hypothetical protein H2201_007646 [Coniosporium apollinis]|uniref:aspartate--tRNA ligase n=1 Tax=Coniosporium apollinis TaxID=61459 RepID=A0ABQ9NIV2_9PEZI|nr:hypothetical protein H2201_007646 [Coniosporium apollinis]